MRLTRNEVAFEVQFGTAENMRTKIKGRRSMTNNNFKGLLLASISTAVSMTVACPAVAQTEPASDGASATEVAIAQPEGGIADIVVTAERRSSSGQRTSIPIEVFDSDALGKAGVSQATDLGRLTAGVQIGAIGATPQVYIRGVGDFGSTAISNPAVAFNINGIYVGRTQSVNGSFYDVERIEVLKGPQGTLYGRNASGGAINIITTRPRLGEVSGNLNLEVGNFDKILTDGAINLPIGDTVAMRAAFQVAHRDGYSSQGLDDDKHQSVRLQAFWEPSDTVNLLLSADYSHFGGRGAGAVLNPNLAGTSPWTDITDPVVAHLYEAASPFPGFFAQPSADQAKQDLEFWNVHAELNVDLGFATLTVLPAYRDASMKYTAYPAFEYRVGQDLGLFGTSPETSKQTTLEVRLGHDGSDGLKWVVGGYFYDESQESDALIYSGFIHNAYEDSELHTRSYAAFGQATLPITQGLRLIAGGRYTYDRRTADRINRYALYPSQTCPDPAVAACLNEVLSGEISFENFSWKVGAEADLAPQSMAYATVSRGFKAGGYSQIASLEAGSTEPSSYLPEILTAYEVGIKNRFFDNKLQLNVEAFYWDYKDHQEGFVTISGTGNAGQIFQNAGKARQYGFDVDVTAMPWNNGTLSFSAEYLNSKYTEFVYQQPAAFFNPAGNACTASPSGATSPVGPVLNIDCSGYQLTRAPKWSGSAGYQHRFLLGDGSKIEAQASMTFASARWLAPEFIAEERASGYVTVDGSVRYTFPSTDLSITAFVRNLTNEAVYTGAFQSPFIPGIVAANIAPPRTYGVRAEFSF